MNLFNPYTHAGMTAPGGDDRRGGLGMLARRVMPGAFQTGGGGQQMPMPQPMTGGPGQMQPAPGMMTGGPGPMGNFDRFTGGGGQMSPMPDFAPQYQTGGPGQMAGGFHPMTGGPGQQMGGFHGMTGGGAPRNVYAMDDGYQPSPFDGGYRGNFGLGAFR